MESAGARDLDLHFVIGRNRGRWECGCIWASAGSKEYMLRANTFLLLLAAHGAPALRPMRPNHRVNKLPLSLPPAQHRDVVAEVMAAASAVTRSSAAAMPPTSSSSSVTKPLVLITVCSGEHNFQQCVGELVQHITTGSRIGTSWVKPLALRVAENATVAAAAADYDPMLGWVELDGEDPIASSHVYVFSPLAPATFVPTAQLVDAPAGLALAVRTMSTAAAAEERAHPNEFAIVQDFIRLLGERQTREGDSPFYDPLA
jgi:hypothetical protein